MALTVPGRWWLAAGFVICGVADALEGVLAFGRACTTVNPANPHKERRQRASLWAHDALSGK